MKLGKFKSQAGGIIRWITYIVAILIALHLPAIYFSTKYQFALGEVETNVRLNAAFITQRINVNPETWKFEEHRLANLLENDVIRGSHETTYSILDQDRQVIAKSSEIPLPWPVIVHEAPLLDSGNIVGYYKVSRSIRSLTNTSLLLALASIALGLVIAWSVNVLPLRALQRAEERLLFMANHDSLTGLPNRAMLKERLRRAMLFAQQNGKMVTIVFIDLDNFKLINDSLGHSAGDEMLKILADRMLKYTRRTDTVVRLGGDEFVIVLPDQHGNDQYLIQILERLRQAISEPVVLGDRKLQVTCSMGLATYPDDGINMETLLMNADAAMYRAKETGRNNYQFYTTELNKTNQMNLLVQEGLRNAIARDEFVLHYQPRIDLKTSGIFGLEALIRWNHPEWGMVMPNKFIHIAEQSGLIAQVGDWVLKTACMQNKAWQNAGMPSVAMAVNVSARQFRDDDYVDKVASALQESGLEARYLELELTESLIMQDLQESISKMRELRAMGVQLAIDDFGTGYSSLSALKGFPIARLKIDRSFVRGIPSDENDNTIVTAMISMGQKLKLKVIAEGVETKEQLSFLLENGCDEVQGYLFSKPVSATDVEELLKLHEGAQDGFGISATDLHTARQLNFGHLA